MAADPTQIPAALRRHELNLVSRNVIGAAHQVMSVLGAGFLEKVYENSLVVELRRRGLQVEQQKPLKVMYGGFVVGDYVADLVVEGQVVVELKTVARLERHHHLQCIHYLKATTLRLGLLINFGRHDLEIRRLVNNF